MKPGAYKDIHILDYHNGEGVSKSQLDLIAKSPAHYYHNQLHKHDRKESEAFKIGRLAHLAVLEPELFNDTVVVAPECDRRTKEGKAIWAAFTDDLANAGKDVLKQQEYTQVRAIQASVARHPAANLLLSGKGPTRELSVYWNEHVEPSVKYPMLDKDVLCRCRPDLLIPPKSVGNGGGIVVDLKTTRDASPNGFKKSVRMFRYDVQAAWYLDGVNQGFAKGEPMFSTFLFIAVEKEPPYGVAVYQLDEADIISGREKARSDLATYAHATSTGVYDAYSPQIQLLTNE
jgi:hypothetical protein